MTPKDKAEELIQEFVFRINEYIEPKTWDEVDSLNALIYKAAIDCARLCVEEILEINPYTAKYYWLEVIKEIDTL